MKKQIILLVILSALTACQSTIEPKESVIQVSEDLKKLVAPYQINKPKYRVNKIVMQVSSVSANEPEIEVGTLHIQPTDTPNIFSIKKHDNDVILGFLGSWLALNIKTAQFNQKLVYYSQDTLWQTAPTGTQFSYYKHINSQLLQYNPLETKSISTCSIIQKVAAHTLHQKIKGNAKKISCKSLDFETIGYYLEDYNFFIPFEMLPNAFYYQNIKITEFE